MWTTKVDLSYFFDVIDARDLTQTHSFCFSLNRQRRRTTRRCCHLLTIRRGHPGASLRHGGWGRTTRTWWFSTSVTWVVNKFHSMLMFDAEELSSLILALTFIGWVGDNSAIIYQFGGVLLNSEVIGSGNIVSFAIFLQQILFCE